jgi:hypothetical protein
MPSANQSSPPSGLRLSKGSTATERGSTGPAGAIGRSGPRSTGADSRGRHRLAFRQYEARYRRAGQRQQDQHDDQLVGAPSPNVRSPGSPSRARDRAAGLPA